MDWMLTDEEIVQLDIPSNVNKETLEWECYRGIAKAEARKMLGWLDEPCDNTKHMYFEQKRCFCSECMQQIRKGVGLED